MNCLILLKYNDLTGVSTFWYTVLSKCTNINFDIYIPDNRPSIIKTKLSEFATIVNTISDKHYDQIMLNYDDQYKLIENKKSIKKFFVHGLMVEHNIPKQKYDSVYVFGERAFDYIKGYSKILIRNGVDIDRFQFRPSKYELQNVLIHDSRNNSFLSSVVLSACSYMGYYTSSIGMDDLCNKKIWNTEHRIKPSDLVIAYGRSAIESMCMGKPVIIYGINGGDGYVTKDIFFKLLETNLSGWSLKTLAKPHELKPYQLVDEFHKYNFNDGYELHKLVKQYLNIELFINDIFK